MLTMLNELHQAALFRNKVSSNPEHREEDGRDDTSRITKKPRRERRMPEYLKDYNIKEIDC